MTPNEASHTSVAQGAIDADLRALTREKRRHFLPAFVAWIAVAAVVFSVAGLRGSLLEQPWWQILAQVGVWTLCLGVLPAVGLGVIFPTPLTRALIICAALGLTVAGSFDWSVKAGGPWMVGPCFALQTVVGVALLAIGGWSGAFLQRARPAAGRGQAPSGVGASRTTEQRRRGGRDEPLVRRGILPPAAPAHIFPRDRRRVSHHAHHPREGPHQAGRQ